MNSVHSGVTLIVALLAVVSVTPSARSGDVIFELSFDGPAALSPGVPATYDVVLTPLEVATGGGAWGWSLGIVAEGLRIIEVTSEDTVAGEIMRQTGFLESYTVFPLADDSDALLGGVAMGGHGSRALTLPEDSPSTILRITVVGSLSPGVESRTAALRFATVERPDRPGTVENLINQLWVDRHVPLVEDLELSVADLPFQRGDTNLDGQLNISDSIFVLGFLFLGTAAPPCLDAADFDDSGVLDISDGHGINVFLFVGSFAPPPPGPFHCAIDPTLDELPCDRTLCP